MLDPYDISNTYRKPYIWNELGEKASSYDTLIVRYCNVSKLSDNLANLALTVLLTTQVHIKHL